MSYDLMVFDPSAPPPDRAGFLDWYKKQAEWSEDHGYNDPAVCSGVLRSWYQEMIEQYPSLNGPDAEDQIADPNFDDSKLTDYSVGRSMIYTCFRWSEVDSAYSAVFGLAKNHKVGFFDVSANDGQVWLPTSDGEYTCVHGTGCSRLQLGETSTWTVVGFTPPRNLDET